MIEAVGAAVPGDRSGSCGLADVTFAASSDCRTSLLVASDLFVDSTAMHAVQVAQDVLPPPDVVSQSSIAGLLSPPAAGVAGVSPGDRILATLDRHGALLTARWQSVHSLAQTTGSMPAATSMLQVSAAMLHMSVAQELISKTVSLSTRAVDGLVKLS